MKSTDNILLDGSTSNQACLEKHDPIPDRFIFEARGKNMKLRKSRFRFGSFAFGHTSHNPDPIQLPSATAVSTDPSYVNDRLSGDSKFRSSSTTSLLRRSNSRLDKLNGSTPVLLAVRKRSNSDSGLDESSISSQNCSPNGGERKNHTKVPVSTKINSKSEGSSKMGGGFFRLFNKSATLLFKHPTTELNPNKPYKGTVITSKDQHASRKSSTLGTSRRTPEEYHYYRRHQRWPSLDKNSSLPRLEKNSSQIGASSSMSSLSSISPLHNHQAYSSGDDSGRPSEVSGASGGVSSTKKSTSSNSVISTCSSLECCQESNYDSGAYSRTSSPEGNSVPALLNTSSVSLSRMPPSQPLVAPSLVLAACHEFGVHLGDIFDDQTVDSVDASFVLSCLDAAAKSSALEESSRRRKGSVSDVSVTIGANTKLTIGPDLEPPKRSGQLRRSRSGLPVLGTTALQRTDSPSKKIQQRNKISTVYLNTSASSGSGRQSRSRVSRSESIVTVSGITQHPTKVCLCKERVTVNGQHHCWCNSGDRQNFLLKPEFERRSPIEEVVTPPDTQPNSLLDI